jgi:uncharacterized membrane protein
MIMKNITAIKTTVLGLAILIFASFLIYKSITHDYYLIGSLYFIGLMLLFTGDGWLNKLQDLVFGFLSKFTTKKTEE